MRAMIAWTDYMARYWKAVRSSKYVIFRLGPVLTLLVIWLFGPIWSGYPSLRPAAFWLAIFWAFVVLFWWSYDVLNEELEKRDAELLRTTPRIREDRAFHVLSKLLQEGKRTLLSLTPDQIEMWDKNVRLTLDQWCQQEALNMYLDNSRPYNQERLTEPQKALDELEQIVNRYLHLYIK